MSGAVAKRLVDWRKVRFYVELVVQRVFGGVVGVLCGVGALTLVSRSHFASMMIGVIAATMLTEPISDGKGPLSRRDGRSRVDQWMIRIANGAQFMGVFTFLFMFRRHS